MTRAFRLQAAALVATGTLAAVASAFGASPAPDTPSPASSSSAPTLDHSASVPQQLVWLRSGAVVRGQLVEFVPGERVVLQLATGEVRTVMWDEVERASWIDAPPAASTLSAAPAAASSVPAPPAASAGVVLHIVSDRPGLWLETRPSFQSGADWKRVCTAPCDTPVRVQGQSLRIDGPGIPVSGPFRIDAHSGHETLSVSSGSNSRAAIGRGALIAGVGLALAAGVAYGLGRIEDVDAAATGGLVGMVTGGVLIVGSLPVLAGAKTTVRNSNGDRVARGSMMRW